MNDNTLYEITVDQTHMNIIIRALSNFMCSNYDAIDLEVVDVAKAMEEIKVASDIQLVLKHQLGKTRHTPKQTAQDTGLIWLREIEVLEPFDVFDETQSEQSQHISELLKISWDNVKEKHWDTIKKMSGK